MKKMKKVRFRLILILAFLVWVIFGGMMLIYREIVKYGITVPKSLRPGALRLVLGGGLVFAGVLLLVILFLSFNTQNLIGDQFFWLFPVMALTEKSVPYLKGRRKETA